MRARFTSACDHPEETRVRARCGVQPRLIGYGAASAVGYARVHDGAHWLSDTVAGAALGIATGRFVTHRADERSRRYSVDLQPMPHGAMLTYTYILH